MTDKQTVNILGWIFLTASFFLSYEVNIICALIFFAAHAIIGGLEDKSIKK